MQPTDTAFAWYLTILMAIFAAVVLPWISVSAWRREQHDRAERRVRDRLEQEEDPEGWAHKAFPKNPRNLVR